MKLLLKATITLLVINLVKCSIDGLSYMDIQKSKKYNIIPKVEDPCNPLYWYPRPIPDYCYFNNGPKTEKPIIGPIPMPIPVPVFPKPIGPVPLLPPPPSPLVPAPLPVGVPFAPNPMMPVSSGVAYPIASNPLPPPFLPYNTYASYGNQQAGMVPGIRGIVTHDGGINILPFSDAYSDMLEKHKQKMIRRKLQRVLDDYEDYPKNYYRLRKRLRSAYID
ncbi:sulfated surface glycoprotein 185-like [Papilio machaon]|uniref:sulfated surface glycoprotein 185-like n=1 Tax=Papilio machaon TaxID=76193 RepID=UPI001E664656|nr:sulfated surface glycoprotein 185-like [Papilio machaon]